MKTFFLFLALVAATVSHSAFALSLNEAKAKGLVGERVDGYVGAVQPDPEARTLADGVNRARKAEYEKIAAQNGQPASVIEKLAAGKLIDRLDAGEYYQDASGIWVKK